MDIAKIVGAFCVLALLTGCGTAKHYSDKVEKCKALGEYEPGDDLAINPGSAKFRACMQRFYAGADEREKTAKLNADVNKCLSVGFKKGTPELLLCLDRLDKIRTQSDDALARSRAVGEMLFRMSRDLLQQPE